MTSQTHDTADVSSFYDDLAESYHLLYADAWDAAVERQSAALDTLIRELLPGARQVLDCACGIGTQAVGLAMCGYAVAGSDLSEHAVARARREAARRGVRLALAVADMRAPPWRARTFDVIVACDNAFSHLLEFASLTEALSALRTVVRREGSVVATLRLQEDMAGYPMVRSGTRVLDGAPRRSVTRTQSRTEDSPLYTVSFEIHDGREEHRYVTRLRSWTRDELRGAARNAGFSEIVWPAVSVVNEQSVAVLRPRG